MKTLSSPSARSCLTAVSILAAAGAAFSVQAEGTDNRVPTVPVEIQVPEGNKVHFYVYAEGVQIYAWNGASWVFQAPEAVLFDSDGAIVGIHYAGPTWESPSGSKVVGARLAAAPSPNPGSIPMLLLQAQSTTGPGIFAPTTYVQRVNTFGGVAPSAPGSVVGEQVRVPYTAEYVFYRANK